MGGGGGTTQLLQVLFVLPCCSSLLTALRKLPEGWQSSGGEEFDKLAVRCKWQCAIPVFASAARHSGSCAPVGASGPGRGSCAKCQARTCICKIAAWNSQNICSYKQEHLRHALFVVLGASCADELGPEAGVGVEKQGLCHKFRRDQVAGIDDFSEGSHLRRRGSAGVSAADTASRERGYGQPGKTLTGISDSRTWYISSSIKAATVALPWLCTPYRTTFS